MDWDTALAAANGAVAGVFDRDAVTIRPKARSNGVNAEAVDDLERAPFDVLVSIELEPDSMMASRRPGGDPAVARQQLSYEAVMTADVSAWPYLPRRGDMVVKSELKFVIASIQDGAGRPAFYLNRAG